MKNIALVGNPNVGKTVIFNLLTGQKQHVANWPGVTIESREGLMRESIEKTNVVDLPGTYSLTVCAVDEQITSDFVERKHANLIVNIVDAANFARNLNLTLQLLDMNQPMIIVLNRLDVAKNKGIEINVSALSKILGVPVIEMVATKKEGLEPLKKAIKEGLETPKMGNKTKYSEIEDDIQAILETMPQGTERWEAIHILELDQGHEDRMGEMTRGLIKDFVDKRGKIQMELLVPNARYAEISKIIHEVFHRKDGSNGICELSTKLDKIFLNKFLAIPIFLLIVLGIFQFAFIISIPFVNLISAWIEILKILMINSIASPWVLSLINDGLISGLGFIFTFLPPIAFLFFSLAWLEDSGYLPRAAFFMNRIMSKIGLHGRAFMPMLMGLGCNVPAIMSTRSIDSKTDRFIAILVNPLISCSARLPVYVLMAGIFFPNYEGLVILSLYALGSVLAAIVALLLRKLMFHKEIEPFILELPSYQWPKLKDTLIKTAQDVGDFLKKVSTFLLYGVLVIWFLSFHPWGGGLETSYLASIGKAIEPIFAPLGFNWQTNVALLSGFVAKELVIGTFGTLYGSEVGGVTGALSQSMDPLIAYTFLVFVLIYTPCIAVINAIRRETNSWKWAGFSIVYSLILAYVVAFLVKWIGGVVIG